MKDSRGSRLAKNSIMMNLRMAFSLGISLYTARVVLEVLEVTNYGIFNLVGGIIALFTFINASMTAASSRFISYEIGKKENNIIALKSIFNCSFLIHLGIALIVLLLTETIGLWVLNYKLVIPQERISDANWLYQLSIFSTMIGLTQVPYTAVIIANEKLSFFAVLDIVQSLLKLVIVFLLIIIPGSKLIIYGFLIMAVHFLIAMSARFYCIKNYEYCHLNPKLIFKEKIVPMIKFSGWDLFGNLAVMGRSQGVSILANLFFGPIANAAIGIADQLQVTITSFASNITVPLKPQVIKSYASGDISYMCGLILRGIKISFLVILFIVLPLLIETNFILNIWLTEVPSYSDWICRWSIIFVFFSNISLILVTGVHAIGRIKRSNLINGILYILVLPITYACYKLRMSIYIPFILNSIFVILGIVNNFFCIKQFIPQLSFNLFLKQILLKCTFICCFAALFPLIIYFNLPAGWFRFLLVCFSSFSMTLLLSWTWGLDKSEKIIIINFIKNMKLFNLIKNRLIKFYRKI